MWFRNLELFRFTEPFEVSAEALDERLRRGAFRPCGKLEMSTAGWVPPLGEIDAPLVHAAGGCFLLLARAEEKLLPPAVVNQVVAERAAAIAEQQGRPVGRRERVEIRDQVTLELLPQAFVRRRHTYAYIAPQPGWLVVDAASSRRAEDLIGLLRQTLGGLAVTPLLAREEPGRTMTGWLLEQRCPEGLILEDECELRDPAVKGGLVRCKRQDPWSEEIRHHLEAGKEVAKLALTWRERLGFVLDTGLGIRRLRPLDLLQEEAARTEAPDERARLDADFTLMSLELARFVPELLGLFGGEAPPQSRLPVTGSEVG